LTPYWKLEQHISDIERKIKSEKEQLAELENSQSRARSNLNAIREHDKQRRYLLFYFIFLNGTWKNTAKLRVNFVGRV